MKITEKEIILGCKNNDIVYQEIFFNLYSKKVNTIVVRYHGKDDKLLIEVFRELFKNIKLIEQDKPVMDWVRLFVARYCINYIKYDTKIELTGEDLKRTTNMIHNMDMSGLDMISVLNKLPQIQKFIFNLFVIEKMTHEDIAELLEISISDVRKELNNSRENLKKYLGNSK